MLSVPAYKLYVTLMLVLHAVIEKYILNSHNVSTVLKKKSSIHIHIPVYILYGVTQTNTRMWKVRKIYALVFEVMEQIVTVYNTPYIVM